MSGRDRDAPAFEPRNPAWEEELRASFERQGVMALIGARLGALAPGAVEIELPFRPDLCQQHGFLHAGITSTIADSAGGYAAFSLMPASSSILSVEFKVNLLAPADGELFRARGRVVKPGKRLFFTELSVHAVRGGAERLCATGQQTNMRVEFGSDGPPPG